MTAKKVTLKKGDVIQYPQTTDDMVFIEGDSQNKTVRQSLSELGTELSQLGQQVIYDVTANNASAKFASLPALLSDENLSTLIPVAVRCGGMSIRFVQSSENKYVQYRLMSQSFTTDVTQWQGVDKEPTVGSTNLVESSGVYEGLSYISNQLLNTKQIASGTSSSGNYPIIANVPTNYYDSLSFKIRLQSSATILSLQGTYVDDNNEAQYIIIIENPTQNEDLFFTLPQLSKNITLYCHLGAQSTVDYQLSYWSRVPELEKEVSKLNSKVFDLDTSIDSFDELLVNKVIERQVTPVSVYITLDVVKGGNDRFYVLNYNCDHSAAVLNIAYQGGQGTEYLELMVNPQKNTDLKFSIPVENDSCQLYLTLYQIESVSFTLTEYSQLNNNTETIKVHEERISTIENSLTNIDDINDVIITRTTSSGTYPVLETVIGGSQRYYKLRFSSETTALALSIHYQDSGDKYLTLFNYPQQNTDLIFSIPIENDSCELYLTLSQASSVTFTLTEFCKLNSLEQAFSELESVVNNNVRINVPEKMNILVLGDSYSEQRHWVNGMVEWLPCPCSVVNLGVTSCTIKDKYEDRTTYPYTSRPTSSDNSGNLNTLACQIEKLKRLMAGTDLDEGETQIYTNPSSYPNVIILEGGMNDDQDFATESTYFEQFIKSVTNVYYKRKNQSEPSLGNTFIKTPIDEVNRTCFAGAYRYAAEKLLELFPNAQIFITTVSGLGYWSYDVTQLRYKQAQQQRKCANLMSFPCIDWNAEGSLNSIVNYPSGSGTQADPYIIDCATSQTTDLMHPKSSAARRYGRLAAMVIRNKFLNFNTL